MIDPHILDPRKKPPNRHLLDARETSLACLKMIKSRDDDRGRPTKYLRLSRSTLQNLSNRVPLSDDFLEEVQAWLWHFGWILFKAGTFFGLARVEAVENWPRSSSTMIADDLTSMKAGSYDFESDEKKITGVADTDSDD